MKIQIRKKNIYIYKIEKLEKVPGIGGLHGKNKGRPSSITPVNRLHMGFTPKSGRLFPTLTTIVASFCFAEIESRI